MHLLWRFNITDLYDAGKIVYAEYDFSSKGDMKIRTFSVSFDFIFGDFDFKKD